MYRYSLVSRIDTDCAAVGEDEKLGGVVGRAAVEGGARTRALIVVLWHVRTPDEAVLGARHDVSRTNDIQQQLCPTTTHCIHYKQRTHVNTSRMRYKQ